MEASRGDSCRTKLLFVLRICQRSLSSLEAEKHQGLMMGGWKRGGKIHM